MKEFIVFRAHNHERPIGTLTVTDEVAREMAAHFKDEDSEHIRMGAGYTKSGDGEIEIKEVSLTFREQGQSE